MLRSALQLRVGRGVARSEVETTTSPLSNQRPQIDWVIRDIASADRTPQPRPPDGPTLLRLAIGGLGLFASSVVAVLLVLAVLPLVTGRAPTVVASGSMEPALRRGDVVVLTEPASEIPIGSIVAFDTADGRVIHRLIEMPGLDTYVAKGDANATADSTLVSRADIVGVGAVVVPLIGFPNLWFSEQLWGSLLAAGVIGGLSIWVGTGSWLARRPRHRRG